jgi:hypothetical protein
MGLDITHDCWHGAYSAFMKWRHAVAEAAGYAIWPVMTDMGFGTPMPQDTIMLDWGHVSDDNLMGEWDELPHDPLLLILAHSDCEGIIKKEFCQPLANRLKEILPNMPKGDAGGHIGDWQEKTQKFIDGLEIAANEEDVEFH